MCSRGVLTSSDRVKSITYERGRPCLPGRPCVPSGECRDPFPISLLATIDAQNDPVERRRSKPAQGLLVGGGCLCLIVLLQHEAHQPASRLHMFDHEKTRYRSLGGRTHVLVLVLWSPSITRHTCIEELRASRHARPEGCAAPFATACAKESASNATVTCRKQQMEMGPLGRTELPTSTDPSRIPRAPAHENRAHRPPLLVSIRTCAYR